MTWQHRYTVLAVLFCTSLLCYLDRMVMATAIPFIAKDFQLSPLTMGSVLSAFFLGYALMQIPGGWLADRFGPRIILTGSILWFSLMSAATGFASGLTTMLILRVSFGLGEGPYPAAASKTVANWFPQREVGRAYGLHLGATGLGATLAPLVVVMLVLAWGWRSVFYVLCIPGLILATLVWHVIRDRATESPRARREGVDDEDLGPAPSTSATQNLLASLRSPAVRWCAITLFLSNITNWGLMNWLPTYLLQARGFGLEQMGTFAALTNFAGVAGSVLGGYVCDRFFAGRLRIPIVLGLLASAGLTWLAAVAATGEWAVTYLVLVFLISNIAFTAIFLLPLVLVPRQAVGGAQGVVNTAGQLAGVLSPLLVGAILEATHGSFEVVLYTLMALTFVAVGPALRIKQERAPR